MKTIKIKDYYGIYQEIPVSDELYEEWRALQNETQLLLYNTRKYITATGPRWTIWRKCRSTLRLTSLRTL